MRFSAAGAAHSKANITVIEKKVHGFAFILPLKNFSLL